MRGQVESKGNVGYMLTQQICEIFAAHDELQLAAWVPLLGQLHLVGLTGDMCSKESLVISGQGRALDFMLHICGQSVLVTCPSVVTQQAPVHAGKLSSSVLNNTVIWLRHFSVRAHIRTSLDRQLAALLTQPPLANAQPNAQSAMTHLQLADQTSPPQASHGSAEDDAGFEGAAGLQTRPMVRL